MLTTVAVMLGWALFIYAMITRPRTQAAPEASRDLKSRIAIVVQAVGFGAIWGLRRPAGTMLFSAQRIAAVLLFLVASVLAINSAFFALRAFRHLGKNWSIVARILESHALITTGPYAVVRHPIYSSMFGLLIATGIALSRWQALVAGTVVCGLGTAWRIRIEERLLKQRFGEEYMQYARRVPAIIPWI